MQNQEGWALSNIVRDFCAVVVGLVFIGLISWSIPAQVYQPCGVLLPTAKLLPAIDGAKIPIYVDATLAPSRGRSLGWIHVMMYSEKPTPAGQEQVTDYARDLAAQAGANVVVINQFFHTVPQTIAAVQSAYVFMGTANVMGKSNDV